MTFSDIFPVETCSDFSVLANTGKALKTAVFDYFNLRIFIIVLFPTKDGGLGMQWFWCINKKEILHFILEEMLKYIKRNVNVIQISSINTIKNTIHLIFSASFCFNHKTFGKFSEIHPFCMKSTFQNQLEDVFS